MMVSVEKPSLWRVLSDASRIISSNSLHFLALSLLFIFPVTLLNAIHSLTVHQSPFDSHYRRLLSAVSKQDSVSEIPPSEKPQIMFQFLYFLLVLVFNLCSVSSITHSVFHGFHSKPTNFSSSLRSILSSFFPLLATKLAYMIIIAAITFGFGILLGFVFLGLMAFGFQIDAASKPVMAVTFVAVIMFIVLFIYLGVKWFLIDQIVVVESKYGFATMERSSNLVAKGTRGPALLMMLLLMVLNLIFTGWYMAALRGDKNSGGVGLQMVAYAGFSTALTLFTLAAKAVFLAQCKAFKGEIEVGSDDQKLGQVVYTQLPQHVVNYV